MESKDAKKKKRRPRSAAGERNYLCGCGKAYLSYPALYTHVKNKHDGVFPIGSNAKRKIPKNGDEESEQLYIPNKERFFQELDEFTKQLPEAASANHQKIRADDIGKFWNFKIEQEERDVAPLRDAMRQLLSLENDANKFEKQKDSLNIYQILAHYLNSIYSYCSEAFFREYVILMVLVVKALNEKGEMFLEKGDKKKTGGKSEDSLRYFCDTTNIHVCAEILNLFIAELFPLYFKKINSDGIPEFKFLGFEDDNIKNLILMTKYLANWLFNCEFTDYRLEINVDF